MSAASILAVFQRFERDDVVHALPALAFDLMASAPDVEVPDSVGEVVRTWMQGRGLTAASTADDVVAALKRTYADRPITFELRAALNELEADERAAG